MGSGIGKFLNGDARTAHSAYKLIRMSIAAEEIIVTREDFYFYRRREHARRQDVA